MPIALAPAAAQSCTPNTPRPPDAPHTKHVVAGLQPVRLVAEQHAVGGRKRQRIAGRLFPRQVLGPRHELAVLHAAELRERAVRRLVAPDALRRREHRVAAVAFLVVAVVLVAVDDDLVADFPALHLRADGPHDAGGVGTRDVMRTVVAGRASKPAHQARPRRRCSLRPRPSRGRGRRGCRASRSARLRAAWPLSGGPCRSLRITHACMVFGTWPSGGISPMS